MPNITEREAYHKILGFKNANKLNEAEEFALDTIKIYPKSIIVRSGLAQIYGAMKETRNLQVTNDEIIALYEKEPKTYSHHSNLVKDLLKGVVRLNNQHIGRDAEKTKRLFDAATKLTKLFPRDIDSWSFLRTSFEKLGSFYKNKDPKKANQYGNAAIKYAGEMIDKFPNKRQGYSEKIKMEFILARYQDVAVTAEREIKQFGNLSKKSENIVASTLAALKRRKDQNPSGDVQQRDEMKGARGRERRL